MRKILRKYIEFCGNFLKTLRRQEKISTLTASGNHKYLLGTVAYFATLPDGYNKDEIARAKDGDFLTVNVSLRIISFLEVDEIYCI